jgi:8-oxo-dGTP diphosphatase
VEVERLVGLYLVPKVPPLVSFAFRCRHVGGEPAVQDEGEIAEVCWFDPASLPSPMTNSGPAAIADAARGKLGVVRTIQLLSPAARSK